MTEENKNIRDSRGDENNHEGHDFDGIRELNNPAPNWIILVFLLTYGFSLFYAIHYFGYPDNGNDQVSEYKQKVADFAMAQRKLKGGSSAGIVMTKEEILAAGAKLFTSKGCIACHGLKGEGNNIGPNMTDNFWINGCSQDSLVLIITEGKAQKGMTPFKTMMTQEQIKNVSIYILEGLVGSNPANAKPPQGVECKP